MLNNFMFYSIGLIMEALLGTPSPVGLSRTPSPLSRSPSPAHRGYKMESKSRTPSPPGKSRNTYIRPHSAKPKKPVLVEEGNEVPVRPMPKLRRPWTAHVKSGSASQKVARQTSKKISRRTPARTEISVEHKNVSFPRKDRSSPKEFSVEQFLLCTPIVTQEEENESNHATLDVGVKTLMSGRIFFYNITFIVNISLFIIFLGILRLHVVTYMFFHVRQRLMPLSHMHIYQLSYELVVFSGYSGFLHQ
jgi:hypothetical protein